MFRYMAVSGVNGINGSMHFLQTKDTNIVLDAGIDINNPALIRSQIDLIPEKPHAVFVSHAHIDHVGALPELIIKFPQMRVYMTYPTTVLAEMMLEHSLNLRERKTLDEELKPLYSMEDLELMFYLFQSMPLKKQFKLHLLPEPDTFFSFWDAGHILGSAGILIESEGKSIFYSANYKLSAQSILKGAHFPKQKADVLILESTYGANMNTPSYSAESERFRSFLSERLELNGVVLIPVFALGRTQEILMQVSMLKRRSKIPSVPIYITGMGTRFTKIYDRLMHKYERRYPDVKLRPMAGHLFRNQKVKGPAIILATSGMMLPQTFSYQLAQDFMDDAKNGLAFVGYVSPESPGYRMREEKLAQLTSQSQTLMGGCKVESFRFSAHAGYNELLELTRQMQPQKVILFHGEPAAYENLAKGIKDNFKRCEVLVPEEGRLYDL